MAILFADNFQSYGTNINRLLDGVFVQASGTNGPTLSVDPDPSAGGLNVLRIQRNNIDSGAFFANGCVVRKLTGASGTSIGVSYRMYTPRLPAGNNDICGAGSVTNNANDPHVSWRVLPNGALEVTRGAYANFVNAGAGVGTVLGTTGPGVITTNSWNHIEIKVFIDNSIGTVEIRVNGATVLDLVNQDTLTTGTIEQVRFVGANTNGSVLFPCEDFYKDLIIWDTTGSQNNNFLGTCAVVTLRPASDVGLNGWTTSSGATGFNLINDVAPVDTSYIAAANPATGVAQFNVTNLPPDIVSVKALLPFTRSRKIDGGDGNLQVGLTGTLTDLGANAPITTAFTYRWDVSELSPDTASPWSPVEVDAVKLDIDRTL